MKDYSRMVIDLYKKSMDGTVLHEDVLSVRTELACALTEKRIKNEPTDVLCSLLKDVEYINQRI